MNFVDVTVIENNGTVILQSDSFSIDISKTKDTVRNYINTQVTLGLRPELLKIVNEKPKESTENIYIKGQVFEFEVRGSDTLVYVKINNQIIKVLESKIVRYDIGVDVWLQLNLKDIFLFDSKSICLTQQSIR